MSSKEEKSFQVQMKMWLEQAKAVLPKYQKDRHPDDLRIVWRNLIELEKIADEHPEQARAVMLAAMVQYYMFRQEIWTGIKVSHRVKPLPRKADDKTIEKYLDQAHKEHPRKNVTELRDLACEGLGISKATLYKRTKYNPIKK